jgi:hypothetical protein
MFKRIIGCNRNSNVVIVSLIKIYSSIYFVVEYNNMMITLTTSSTFSAEVRFFKFGMKYTTVCKIVSVRISIFHCGLTTGEIVLLGSRSNYSHRIGKAQCSALLSEIPYGSTGRNIFASTGILNRSATGN